MRTICSQATLREVRPPVIRLLDVSADATLPELHDLRRAVPGWIDSHLHEFVVDERRWAIARPHDISS